MSSTAPKTPSDISAAQKTMSLAGCAMQCLGFAGWGRRVLPLGGRGAERGAATGSGGFLGSVAETCPAYRHDFCGPNAINHFFCDPPPVPVLSCSDAFPRRVVTFLAGAGVGRGLSLWPSSPVVAPLPPSCQVS